MSGIEKIVALSFSLSVLACCGCSDSEPGRPVTTDMHEDFDHEHKHQHTGGDDHEHGHEDGFEGAHSHGHTHSHRHGEALHGGRIVSIGHTHHKDGASHFHAEVMPLNANTIGFHLLTETEEGESRDFPVDEKEISAVISIQGQESNSSECTFVAVGDGGPTAEFSLMIPEAIIDGGAYSVVIPSVTLDGQRQNFSFSVTRKETDSDSAQDADATESGSGNDNQESSDE